MIWPFLPQAGSSETLEFMTQVLSSFSGEQRIKLRKNPRLTLSYTHQMSYEEYVTAKMTFREESLVGGFQVPVWSDVVKVGAVASAATVLTFDTTESCYSSQILIWESAEKYVVRTIASMTSTTVTLTAPVGLVFTDAHVAPVKNCYATGGLSASRAQYNETIVSANFQSRESEDYTYTPDLTYDGKFVVSSRYYANSGVEDSISRPVEYFDNGFGLVEMEAYRDVARNSQQITFRYQNKTERWKYRRMVYAMDGMQKSFWLPTFNYDLVPLADLANSVRIVPRGAGGAYVGKKVFTELLDGTVYIREIVSGSFSGADLVLQLDTPFPQPVGPSNLYQMCFMNLVRSDTDSFTFPLDTTNKGVVSFNTVEVPQ